jgi:hypothetical protein
MHVLILMGGWRATGRNRAFENQVCAWVNVDGARTSVIDSWHFGAGIVPP